MSYFRVVQPDGSVKVSFYMAKARPSPIKRRSIPMLELQAAVLGARLGTFVAEALKVPMSQRFFWTDSMNVLYWVRSPSRKFKLEVGNRVSEIQRATDSSNWRHVSGITNPADLPTRGLSANKLSDSALWWSGPSFLSEDSSEWPARQIVVPQELPGLLKKQTQISMSGAVPVVTEDSRLHPEHFSSFGRLVRVTAWCSRFVRCLKAACGQIRREEDTDNNNAKVLVSVARGHALKVPTLNAQEVVVAELHWVSVAQREAYGMVIEALQASREMPQSAPLQKLCPRLDTSAGSPVLRVGAGCRPPITWLGLRTPLFYRQSTVLPR